MCAAPNAIDVVYGVRYPMETAFSDPLCWNEKTPRNKVEERSQPLFQFNGKYSQTYNRMLDRVYSQNVNGIPWLFNNHVLASLGGWGEVWSQATNFCNELTGQDYNLDHNDVVALQESMLKMYAKGPDLAKVVRAQVQTMENMEREFGNLIAELKKDVNELSTDWCTYANSPPANRDKDYDRTRAWFDQLNKWSDLMEPFYNLLPFYEMGFQRFQRVRAHLNEMPAIIETLSSSFFDLYGNLLSGNQADVDSCRADFGGFTDKIKKWASSVPAFGRVDYQHKHVFRGELCYTRGAESELRMNPPKEAPTGDDPDSINVGQDDLQVGLAGFHFQYWSTEANMYYNRMAIALDTKPKARRVWKQAHPYCEMRRSNLSWITIPPKLRERVQFSWTSLYNKDGVTYASSPQESRYEARRVYERGPYEYSGIEWRIKFPRQFSSSGRITVRPWILDFDGQGFDYDVGFDLVVVPNSVTNQECLVRVNMPNKMYLMGLKVGYVAYEEAGTLGFHSEQTRVTVDKSLHYKGQNHNFDPVFFSFPRSKFQRRPAMIAMMSSFVYTMGYDFRADTRIAVSRDGFVIQGHSQLETIVHDLAWQMIAIANEPW